MAHFPVYGRKWVRQGAPRLTHYLPITAVFAVYGLFMAHINYPSTGSHYFGDHHIMALTRSGQHKDSIRIKTTKFEPLTLSGGVYGRWSNFTHARAPGSMSVQAVVWEACKFFRGTNHPAELPRTSSYHLLAS